MEHYEVWYFQGGEKVGKHPSRFLDVATAERFAKSERVILRNPSIYVVDVSGVDNAVYEKAAK